MTLNINPIHILLAEDDPGDVFLIQEAFKEAKIVNQITVVTNGMEVLDCLNKSYPFQNHMKPDLILLDINMPKKNGFEVLKEIKNNPEFKDIPVLILTASKSEKDIINSYNLMAHGYLLKPLEINQLLIEIKSFDKFGISIVKCSDKFGR